MKTRLPWLVLAAAAAAAQDVPRFGERVEVERILVDVRVVDGRGNPILGLAPGDFRVKVDGKMVPLESAQWVAGSETTPEAADALAYGETVVQPPGEAPPPEPPPGRLMVFFFQIDAFEGSRIRGTLRMQKEAERFVSGLAPADQVAVAAFDHHLKLHLDFTTDRDRLRRLVRNVTLLPDPPQLYPGDEPSLAAHFDRDEGKKAASAETALLLLGRSLQQIPGPKSLVFFGYGLGRLQGRAGVHMEPDYGPARQALEAARATVFCLDVTEADYHSLEVGLQKVAEDTGGFYARTHLFSGQGLDRLQRALVGFYVLAFEKPAGPKGEHRLSVDLVGRKGEVLAKTSFTDR